MTEQTSNTGAAPAHKPNFVEKIVDKIKHHGHGHGQNQHQHQQPATTTNASQKMRHTYGGPDNEHDNAYVAEASMVGAHAIPPMTFHTEAHRSDHVSTGAPQAAAQAQQTSAPTGAHGHSPNEPFHEFGDRVAGHDLHSAENERQRPVM
ncbi:hypothetical protein BGZ70_008180 [Mortierella alpina]|uniref:Uncharacterized protein n=1 Tax=Mortierella alpina TaxID=64518 RepID=A0A9P6M5Z7_MORAP|nr:hypothetical protein BGZ70_008180 [Mortierella alpina]